MNTRYLATFLAVAKYGTMAEAARRLRLTQGAVAQQIKTLEDELQVELVSRAGRTVTLTERGRALCQPIAHALQQFEQLTHLSHGHEVAGEIRVGASFPLLTFDMPIIVKELLARHPDVTLKLQVGQSPEFYAELEAGTLDVAIALEAPHQISKLIGWEWMHEEEFMLIAHQRHAGRHPHDLLASEPFIRYTRTEWGGYPIEGYLRRAGIQPAQRIESGLIPTIGKLVAENLGVAILPISKGAPVKDLPVVCMPLPEPCERRRYGLAWSRKSPKLSLIDAFRQAILNTRSERGH